MTLAEANILVKELTRLTVMFWDESSYNRRVKYNAQFQAIWKKIISNSFKIKRSRQYDPVYRRIVPIYKVTENKDAAYVEIYSNTPKDLKIKGDCTTRCIALCTGIDYMVIRNEQLKNANYSSMWRVRSVWEKSLLSRGFKRILLTKRMARKTFIKTFGDQIKHGIIATHSSGHIAAIDMAKKKVIDTWNSSGGRIDFIYVHESQYNEISNIIKR